MEVIRKKLGGLKKKLDVAEKQANDAEEELNSINLKAEAVSNSVYASDVV